MPYVRSSYDTVHYVNSLFPQDGTIMPVPNSRVCTPNSTVTLLGLLCDQFHRLVGNHILKCFNSSLRCSHEGVNISLGIITEPAHRDTNPTPCLVRTAITTQANVAMVTQLNIAMVSRGICSKKLSLTFSH